MRYAVVVCTAVFIASVASVIAEAADEGGTPNQPLTIGIVDVKRVVEECEYRALYKTKIIALQQQKQLEGVDLKKEVDAKISDLQREQFLRAGEAREEIQKEIEAEEQRLRAFVMAAQKEIEDKNHEFSQELEDKIKAIVEAVAEERGVNLVLNSMAVLYKSGVIDLTDLVLEKLNEDYRTQHGSPEGSAGAAGGSATATPGTESKED
ncbi:MAG: OmpH family outer membrane protein [Verrucomicrobia bacterium]|nr:OmpH family outer membrane protein [Verrucomicrobiota bacterium]